MEEGREGGRKEVEEGKGGGKGGNKGYREIKKGIESTWGGGNKEKGDDVQTGSRKKCQHLLKRQGDKGVRGLYVWARHLHLLFPRVYSLSNERKTSKSVEHSSKPENCYCCCLVTELCPTLLRPHGQ